MSDPSVEGDESYIIGVFVGAFPPAFRGGGPTRSVDALVRSTPEGVNAYVLTSDRDLGLRHPLPVKRNVWLKYGYANVYYGTLSSVFKLFVSFCRLRGKYPQILHFNSFFDPRLTIAPLMLWRLGFWGRPTLLLTPRGEFGDGALGRRSWKKRLYIVLFKLLRIDRSIVWHSTAEHETQAIHAIWGKTAKVIFRENDTLLPLTASPPMPTSDESVHAVFLSRIVELKGLLVAIQALKGCTAPFSLDVYGPQEDKAYIQKCEQAAQLAPPHVSIRFCGTVQPEDVPSVLAGYDIFLFPTAGENFGHVIAEALSVSCAVVTTPYTPWTELLRGGAGLLVADRAIASWHQAIESIARMTRGELQGLRSAAGDGYSQWAARPRLPHVWDLVRAQHDRDHE